MALAPGRTDASTETPASAPAEGSVVHIHRAEAEAAAVPQAAEAQDPAELADEIYERIERRLRSELFSDLERRGQLSRWG